MKPAAPDATRGEALTVAMPMFGGGVLPKTAISYLTEAIGNGRKSIYAEALAGLAQVISG